MECARGETCARRRGLRLGEGSAGSQGGRRIEGTDKRQTFLVGKFSRNSAIALLVGGVLLALLSATQIGRRLLTGVWRPVTTSQTDNSVMYRLVVDVHYKGAPVQLNVVVGCNVGTTRQIDRSTSVDFVGTAPFAYGLKMADGAGLVVRPPDACGRETTANGQVPNNLMPLLIVYENADKPTLGVAYASDDAYDSPLSVLKFGSATISRVTREELVEWRRTEAPKNIIKKEFVGRNLDNPFAPIPWTPGRWWFGNVCAGVSRLELPRPIRDAIRPFWQESKGKYWVPSVPAQKAWNSANIGYGSYDRSATIDTHLPYAGPHFTRFDQYSPAEFGVLRRDGSGAIRHSLRPPGEILPSRSELSLNNRDAQGLPITRQAVAGEVTARSTQLNSELRGFLICDAVDPGSVEGYPLQSDSTKHPANTTIVERINGEVVKYPADMHWWLAPAPRAFERDAFIFRQISFHLESLGSQL